MEAELKTLIAEFQKKALAVAKPVTRELTTAQQDARTSMVAEQAAVAEAAKLRSQLKTMTAKLTRLENVNKPRGLFEMKEDFDPKLHLSKDAQVLYHAVWEYIEAEYRKTAAKIIAGIYPYTANTPFPNGVIHDQSMRTIQQLTHSALFVLERWGDPRAVKMLDEMWSQLLVPARLTDRFPADIEKPMPHLEQVGTLRMIFWGDKTNPDENIANSDLVHLETSLVSGVLQENSYALSQNAQYGFFKGHDALNWYLPHLRARLEFLGGKLYPNKPWWYVGSVLRHAATSRYCYFYFRFLERGEQADKVAYEQIGKWLADDVCYCSVDGVEIATVPHVVQGWAAARGNTAPPGHQDVTYLRESAPHDVLAMLAGSPFHPKRFIAATSRCLHELCIVNGPKSGLIAASTGGCGVSAHNSKSVVSRGEKSFPSRWRQSRAHQTDAALEMTRGLTMVGTAFAGVNTYWNNLRDQLTLPDVDKSQRWGHRVAFVMREMRLGR